MIQLFWPTDYDVITQRFGANPQNYARFGLPGHEGIDFRAPHRTNISACADGVVYRVSDGRDGNNYGRHVRIEHADGYKTIYAHMDEPLVEVGDEVKMGQRIGLADNTGNSFGSHLHLSLKREGEVARGYYSNLIDPTPFLMPFGWTPPEDEWDATELDKRIGDSCDCEKEE